MVKWLLCVSDMDRITLNAKTRRRPIDDDTCSDSGVIDGSEESRKYLHSTGMHPLFGQVSVSSSLVRYLSLCPALHSSIE